MKKIAITLGDPNSISPEIIIKALNKLQLPKEQVILVANKLVFDFYENNYGLKLNQNYKIIDIPYKCTDIKIAEETKEAGEFSFQAIKKSCELGNNKEIDAIVTGPVSKYAMNLAGHNYAGQTEIIEKFIKKEGQNAEMLFVSGKIKILLLTRHVALKELPELITKELILSKIETLHTSLKKDFNIKNPKIALCSLNPHAGENGLFGDEEVKEYIPAVNILKAKGINIDGPFPSDGLFANLSKEISKGEKPYYDCYVASYHDQGLIPIKLLAINESVNTTIGLDVIRTSPAHGTAFDIAGKNIANEQSLICAIKTALNITTD